MTWRLEGRSGPSREIALGWAIGSALLLVAIAAAAVVAPLLGLALIGVVLVASLAVRRPEVVVALTAIVVPTANFHPTLLVPSPIGQLTPPQIVIFVSAAAVLLARPSRLRPALRAAPGVVGAAITIAGTISAVLSGDPVAMYWVINCGLLLIALSVILGDRYRANQRGVESWILLAGLVLAASVIAEMLVGQQIAWFGVPAPAPNAVIFRPAGLTGNGLVSGAVLGIILALLLTSQSIRRFRLVAGAVLLVAIFGTLTRSAVIAAATTLVLFVLIPPKGMNRLRRSRFAVATLGIPVFLWLYQTQVAGLEARLVGGVADLNRLEALRLAFDYFLRHPVVGLGLGGFKRVGLAAYGTETADNTLVTLAVELGVIGVVLIFIAMMRVRRIRITSRAPGSLLPLVMWGVVALFFDAIYHDGPLFLLAVALLRSSLPMSDTGSGRLWPTPGMQREVVPRWPVA